MCGFDNRKFSRNLAIIRVPFSTTNLVLVGKSVTGATLVAVLSTERPRRHPKAFGTPFHFIVWTPSSVPRQRSRGCRARRSAFKCATTVYTSSHRSEERRVGKECRCEWWRYQYKKDS